MKVTWKKGFRRLAAVGVWVLILLPFAKCRPLLAVLILIASAWAVYRLVGGFSGMIEKDFCKKIKNYHHYFGLEDAFYI